MASYCDISIGDLKHLVTIERRTRTSDGMGGYTESWEADPADGIYCKMQFLTGTERWEYYRNVPGNLIRLTTRFKDDGNGAPYWTTADRVKYRGRTYDILAISDVDWDRMWIKIDCYESGAS